jgi:hypothetical protein
MAAAKKSDGTSPSDSANSNSAVDQKAAKKAPKTSALDVRINEKAVAGLTDTIDMSKSSSLDDIGDIQSYINKAKDKADALPEQLRASD